MEFLTDKKRYLAAREDLRSLAAEGEGLLKRAEAEGRDLTAAEAARDREISAKFDELKPIVEQYEAQRARDLAKAEGMVNGRTRPGRIGARLADLFPVSTPSAFESFEQFAGVIGTGLFDQRLITASTMTEGEGSAGGFLVPQEYVNRLLGPALEDSIFFPRARVEPMNYRDLLVSGFDFSDMSSDAPAGISAQWLEEAGTATVSKGKTRRIQLIAKRVAGYAEASLELAEDAPRFDTDLGDALAKSVAWAMDVAFLRGTGAGQPLGALNSASTITVAKETGQPNATIVYENIVKMFARLHPASVARSLWLVHPSTLPQLLAMAFKIENAAGTDFVGGSQVFVQGEGGQLSLLSRPVLITEKASVLGTIGDIVLVDPSQYVIGMRRATTLERSNAPGWTEAVISYRMIARVDGQPLWSTAYTPRGGADTLSWCVTLATRA